MGIPIKRGIEAIPGGMAIVPLTLGGLVTMLTVPLIPAWRAKRLSS